MIDNQSLEINIEKVKVSIRNEIEKVKDFKRCNKIKKNKREK